MEHLFPLSQTYDEWAAPMWEHFKLRGKLIETQIGATEDDDDDEEEEDEQGEEGEEKRREEKEEEKFQVITF